MYRIPVTATSHSGEKCILDDFVAMPNESATVKSVLDKASQLQS